MMKYIIMMFAAVSFMLAGCQYEAPLTKEHTIKIDPAVPGVWEFKQDKDDLKQKKERLIVLKYSDTEYLIHYPVGGNDEVYYRGYPIKIGGVSCVQLQAIGTDNGPFPKDERDLFFAVSYRLTGDQLEIKLLNTDLVDKGLKTTDELRKVFLKHKDNKELFNDPGVFIRIK